MATLTSLKIAYTGGGSRDWARKSKIELALCLDLSGEARLYDNDSNPVNLSEISMNWIQNQPGAESCGHLVGFLPGFIHSPEILCIRSASLSPVSCRIQRRKSASIVNQHRAEQELGIESAPSENDDPSFQAINDPRRHLSLDAAWELSKKLLQLNYEYLPATAVI